MHVVRTHILILEDKTKAEVRLIGDDKAKRGVLCTPLHLGMNWSVTYPL